VVSEAEFVDQCRRESVNFAERQAAVTVVLIAGGETATIEFIGEWSRSKDWLVFVAEASEVVVLIRKAAIDANVGIVLIPALRGVAKEIVAAEIEVWRGIGIQGS